MTVVVGQAKRTHEDRMGDRKRKGASHAKLTKKDLEGDTLTVPPSLPPRKGERACVCMCEREVESESERERHAKLSKKDLEGDTLTVLTPPPRE